METTERIINHFDIKGTVEQVKKLGNGLINDTFLVETGDGAPRYVLQRINTAIFTDPDLLQNNILAVTSHIRNKLAMEGVDDIDRKVLTVVKTREGNSYYRDEDNNCWRLTVYIEGSHTVEEVNEHTATDAGRAFGHFEAMLTDLPVTPGETIPDFHNMELRARQLIEAINANRAGRMNGVSDITSCLLNDMDRMCGAERLHRQGVLPKRVCHCDTKVNNMLLDDKGNVLCVIDLDTVMPAFVFSDYGDFLRTAASEVPEDCDDLSRVKFRENIFEAFTRGYLDATSHFLTRVEIENLPFAVELFPFMQCVRFITDYINGDTYYKIAYPEHNLVRARNQLALYREIGKHRSLIEEVIAKSL